MNIGLIVCWTLKVRRLDQTNEREIETKRGSWSRRRTTNLSFLRNMRIITWSKLKDSWTWRSKTYLAKSKGFWMEESKHFSQEQGSVNLIVAGLS